MANYNYKPATYEVTACGQVYYYALHSERKNKIIFLSQVLNILEYVLFRKMKDGFKADGGVLTAENFPFEVTRLKNRQPDPEAWTEHDAVVAALRTLLQDYYNGASRMLDSGVKEDLEEPKQETEQETENQPSDAPRVSPHGEVWNP